MFTYISQIWNNKNLRNKIGFTIFGIIVFRLLAHIPIPGADISGVTQALSQNQLLGVFSLMTGGGLEKFSVILIGIGPYITASIIIQLMTVVIPRLEALSKEGEQGRRVINKYTRYLTIPLAFLQSYGMIKVIDIMNQTSQPVITDQSWQNMVFIMLIVTTGTMVLLWLGELISEKGIGNGVSVIIFGGIISRIPSLIGSSLSLISTNNKYILPVAVVFIFVALLTLLVVLIAEGQRRIPVTYAGQRMSRSAASSYIPLRVNQAGMIPIIFANSLIAFPSLIANFFINARSEWLRNFATKIGDTFNSSNPYYLVVYFGLVFLFTYFYVSVTFNPEQVADNIQKRGGFVPGIRPGKQTADYLGKISNRITLLGASFLGFIVITPLLAQTLTQSQFSTNIPLLISGAGLIIVVGVVLELIRQINSQMIMQDYEKLY